MTVSSGDFRVYMRQLAGLVWDKQHEAHRFGLSLQEETITELLLLKMASTLSPLGSHVRLFTRPQEGGRKKQNGTISIEAEGADWEWYLVAPNGCAALFRVQAKKLYRDEIKPGRYGGFKPGGTQISDLIRRAKQIEANPIYVLYNHPDVADAGCFGPTRQPDYFGRTCWGCSVTTAQVMARATDDRLQTLKPHMLPWHRFFGVGGPCRTASAMKQISDGLRSGLDEPPQEFVSSRELPDWVPLLMDSQSTLDEYLVEHNLRGVALMDFSELYDFRGG